MTRKNKWYYWVMVVAVLFLLGAPVRSYGEGDASFVSEMSPTAPSVPAAGSSTNCKKQVHFVPNSFLFWDNSRHWTTSYGPAYANILLKKKNFLPCSGGPFALCYYSGPNPQSCTVTDDGRFANCDCFEIPYGAYFVDINAILNYGVYLKTVEKCGQDGRKCQETNQAPVCEAINRGQLIPGANLISAFSFDCVPEEGIGQTNCSRAPYAGCMTAPCYRTGEKGIVKCSCPIFDGPYQVGQFGAQCALGGNVVWSAAFNPNNEGKTFPTPPRCIPDAPGEFGCPLLSQEIPPPPPNVDCKKVCKEYQSCRQRPRGVEIGFTCAATLCTSTCNDRDLVEAACSGLQNCEISEIVKLETEVGCSCCASQICGCTPDDKTNAAISVLNKRQRNRGITPQCDLNGTLCGVRP
ncbi:MAG TPA: hypothetical protein VMW38_01800 [Terriglobia bacterium]|nr:hypothetical protein [Terriglobia bacterium]